MLTPNSDQLTARLAQLLADVHPFAYALVAPNLTITFASPELEQRMFPLPKPLIGFLLSEWLWEFVGLEELLQQLLVGEVPAFVLPQINRQLPDGSIAYFNFQIVPADPQHPAAGLLLLIENSTYTSRLEQKLTQNLNELRLLQNQLAQTNETLYKTNRLKSLFLAMAAHDLRAPLSVIRGYVDLLLESPTNQFHQQKLQIVLAQADWLDGLITNLLDLERIEQHKLVLHTELADFNYLVQEAVQFHQIGAELQEVKLSLKLAEEAMIVPADRQRFTQIINNLLTNALKYTPPGGQITISTYHQIDKALLVIQDTGWGISHDQIGKIFDLYYQVESNHHKAKGTGIGLYIVKHLVEAHGGHIHLSSELRKGTKVEVSLPLLKE